MSCDPRAAAALIASCLSLCACGGAGSSSHPSTPPPPFRVLSPNGAESWVVASQRTVLWSVGTYSGNVDVDLSTDGGATWQLLVAATPNDGSVTVTVPDFVGSRSRIQVSAADGDPARVSLPSDVSDADFTIERIAFVAGPTLPIGGPLAWGDYDKDGAQDLALAADSSGCKVYRSDGGGTFTAVPASLAGVEGGNVAWGDYDQDGDLDLVVTGHCFTISRYSGPVTQVYRNDGGGVFTEIGAGIVGVEYGMAAWGDYDGDGRLDLAVTGFTDDTATTSTTRVYHNDGGGKFTDISASLPGLAFSALAWGDFDGDGHLDLALCGYDGTRGVTSVYRNDGGGSFTDVGAGIVGVYEGSLVWGDYDGDGRPDLAIAGLSGAGAVTRIYHNDGGGVFTDVAADLIGVYSCSLAWGDFDGDGDLDLALGGHTGATQAAAIYRYDGGGSFQDIHAALVGGWHCSLAWGDPDGRGVLDLALDAVDGTGGHVGRIYENVAGP